MPVAVIFVAGHALMVVGLPATIGRFNERATPQAIVPIFARRREVAVIVAVAPFIATADFAVKAVGVDVERVTLIVAIDIAAQGVAEQSAQQHATDDGTGITVTRGTTDQSAADRAKDRARRRVAAMAVSFVVAFAIGRRRSIVVAVVDVS